MSCKYILEIKLSKDFPLDIKDHYSNYECNGSDSGVDLIVPQNMNGTIGSVITLNHQISCQLCKYVDNKFVGYVSYWLLPRSSISKTNFRMANSVGLIDSGYRGNIMAKLDIIPHGGSNTYTITKNTKLFQIAVGDLTPISQVKIVETLSTTSRGEGGFGSTGT
ncbi:putative deoxyuridine 5'-triphosphate nucleotidohydrolase [Cafeteria roenbergensis virus]|uniref:dUTP diphosphatase n=1 Tax=Cafeteria roenbergensis virus (strain BV-PW1) TaxID=693272 RepID=E3T4I9_CROVB|nr:putative deoxyuridine 5'-triphosphate nucleotidohydrolase [Cafeteria roenbergensis virus BV-PW1]ADO67102.1 putative deoxyuridine 5'-triphosphate nucleotidohydrolase [Cafeteria roenbergensis virus BV-PW1]